MTLSLNKTAFDRLLTSNFCFFKMHICHVGCDVIAIDISWSEVKLLSRVQLFATPWTIAYQAPLSMEFSRQEYWSGLPFPSPGDLPDSGMEPRSPALQADALPSEPPGKPQIFIGAPFFGGGWARIPEWVAIPFSRRSSWPRDQTQVSRTVGRCFTTWAILPYGKNYIYMYIHRRKKDGTFLFQNVLRHVFAHNRFYVGRLIFFGSNDWLKNMTV